MINIPSIGFQVNVFSMYTILTLYIITYEHIIVASKQYITQYILYKTYAYGHHYNSILVWARMSLVKFVFTEKHLIHFTEIRLLSSMARMCGKNLAHTSQLLSCFCFCYYMSVLIVDLKELFILIISELKFFFSFSSVWRDKDKLLKIVIYLYEFTLINSLKSFIFKN